jgi:hypothetical protein
MGTGSTALGTAPSGKALGESNPAQTITASPETTEALSAETKDVTGPKVVSDRD